MNTENQKLRIEILKTLDFINCENIGDLSDGEVLDHVVDKLKTLVEPTPYIDDWAEERKSCQ